MEMAKSSSVPVIAVLCVLLLPLTAMAVGTPFYIEGSVYCDTCRFGFETIATKYISGLYIYLRTYYPHISITLYICNSLILNFDWLHVEYSDFASFYQSYIYFFLFGKDQSYIFYGIIRGFYISANLITKNIEKSSIRQSSN